MGGLTSDLAAGILVAFLTAVVAVWLDIHDTMKAQLGSSRMWGLLVREGWWFLLVWGIFDAALFLIILHNPNWAQSTFGFNLNANKIVAGAAVGLSAVFVIRSKLTKIGNVELGGEWVYLWSRAYVLGAVSQRWGIQRIKLLNTYELITKDAGKYPKFYTDLEGWILTQLNTAPDDKEGVRAQMERIRKSTADPGKDANARADLTAVALDFLGPKRLEEWAIATKYRE
jgi:hypothetical protein